jgi:hypothetical protein
MENLSAGNITGKTIPTTATVINGNDVLLVHPKQVQTFVDHAINGNPGAKHHHKHHHNGSNPANAKCIY